MRPKQFSGTVRLPEQGYANAQNQLGWCYERGVGVPKNRAEAVKWYRKAAEQGNSWVEDKLNSKW